MYQPTPADFDALVSLARARGTDPLGVALLLFVESAGFNPANMGPKGDGAVSGLNQMSRANLAALNGMTPAAWTALSAAEQLPWVFQFWDGLVKSFAAGVWPTDGAHLLALNFLPAYYQKTAAVSPTTPIVSKGDPNGYYAANASTYDPQGTGAITVNTIVVGQQRQTQGSAAPRWSQIASGVQAALARATTAPDAPSAGLPAASSGVSSAPSSGSSSSGSSTPTVAQASFGVVAVVGGALWLLWRWLERR